VPAVDFILAGQSVPSDGRQFPGRPTRHGPKAPSKEIKKLLLAI
jgi:hypothetical protein